MVTLLNQWEKIKDDKHVKQCHKKQKHVSPFVISVDGILGAEALVVLSHLSQLMADKMDESISHVQI